MARSLGAVLVTDMVGSTELLGRLGTAGAIELRRSVDDIVERAVSCNGGTVVDTNGDGHVARFATGSAALHAATAIQRANESDDAVATTDRVLLRIGVSAGEFGEIDGRPVGHPVDQATALQRRCRPGGVLASETLLGLLAEVPADICIGASFCISAELVAHEVGPVGNQ